MIEKKNRLNEVIDELWNVLGNGADDELWPPGLSLPEAVDRLVEERYVQKEYIGRLIKEVAILRDENTILRTQILELKVGGYES